MYMPVHTLLRAHRTHGHCGVLTVLNGASTGIGLPVRKGPEKAKTEVYERFVLPEGLLPPVLACFTVLDQKGSSRSWAASSWVSPYSRVIPVLRGFRLFLLPFPPVFTGLGGYSQVRTVQPWAQEPG